MVLNIFVGEHSLVMQNVIDEDVVTLPALFTFSVVVVVVVLENLATLVDDSLMECLQVVALFEVLVVARR